METIKLDLIPGKKMPSLHASQYDDGRAYHIDLTENRVPYVLDGTETISLTVRKCDNTLVTMDIANTFADKSYIEFITTEQMCACSGFNYGEITLEKNGDKISSLNFYLQVEGAPDEGGITSQSEINNLARQVHDAVVEELEDNGAEDTGYDNTESGLEATNVQDAIDEINTKFENIPSVDAYTKEESDDKFATKNALQTVAAAIPTKTSQLQNDSGFATIDDSEASASKVYSSNKVNGLLGNKASASEVENIRIGADGTTYASAGDAVRGQVEDLKNAIDDEFDYQTNLLDSSKVTVGQLLLFDGTTTSAPNKNVTASDYIKLKKGVYTYKSKYSYYGSNVIIVPTYDDNKDFVANVNGTRDGDLVTFELSSEKYVRLKLFINDGELDSMLVEGSNYPNSFISYFDYNNQNRLSENVMVDASQINDLNNGLVSIGIGENINVEEQQEITINDYYVKSDGSHGDGAYSATITIHKGETYKIKAETGSNVIAYVISTNNNIITRYASKETWGTEHNYDIEITAKDYEDGGTLTVNSIYNSYIGIKKVNSLFVFDGERIVDNSIPDSKLHTHPSSNPLFGKIAVFDGDSICHGTSVGQQSPYYRWGWAGRIGTANSMEWHNVAQSGATITHGLKFSDQSNRHWVSSYIDTIYANYPDADYIILEGGTNDADLLHNDESAIGTISPSDFSGNYDNTTYCGALEYLFYNAENLFPNAKIGFIIAQKMGTDYATRTNRKRFFDLAIDACKKWSVPFLNLWDESGLSPNVPSHYSSGQATNLYTDSQHLTDAGYDFINRKIESWMQTL